MLQNALIVMIPHYAGLNPKSYRYMLINLVSYHAYHTVFLWYVTELPFSFNRALRSRRKELNNPQKTILDGDLLFTYFDLSFNDRNDVSKKAKATTEQVREKKRFSRFE